MYIAILCNSNEKKRITRLSIYDFIMFSSYFYMIEFTLFLALKDFFSPNVTFFYEFCIFLWLACFLTVCAGCVCILFLSRNVFHMPHMYLNLSHVSFSGFFFFVFFFFFLHSALPRCLSGERVRLTTWWLWVRNPIETKYMCITGGHDMTLAVKVVLKPNTTNQIFFAFISAFEIEFGIGIKFW